MTDAPRRPRNAAATRTAILEAAKAAFLRDSFEGAGIREIAAAAGVDPALVNRYFGSKAGLFRSVLGSFENPAARLGGDIHDIAGFLVDQLTAPGAEADPLDPMIILLRSSSSPQAAEEIRRYMKEDVLQPLAMALGGKEPERRAATAVSFLMGLTVMRRVLLSSPPEEGQKRKSRQHLVRLLELTLSE